MITTNELQIINKALEILKRVAVKKQKKIRKETKADIKIRFNNLLQ